jgi:hypothetical protein
MMTPMTSPTGTPQIFFFLKPKSYSKSHDKRVRFDNKENIKNFVGNINTHTSNPYLKPTISPNSKSGEKPRRLFPGNPRPTDGGSYGENSALETKSDKSGNSGNMNTQTPKSIDNLENELNRVNHDIREIKNMKIPWEERFDLLSDHIKGCMRHLRILRKEYDDLFGCYEKKFRETRSMKTTINELESE